MYQSININSKDKYSMNQRLGTFSSEYLQKNVIPKVNNPQQYNLMSKSSKSIPKKEFRDSSQAFSTTQGVKSTAQLQTMAANPNFANLGSMNPSDMTVNYASSHKNIKLKFDKTTNLANISSLANTKSASGYNLDGRYKKKNSEQENDKKKISSHSGRNPKNVLNLTATITHANKL